MTETKKITVGTIVKGFLSIVAILSVGYSGVVFIDKRIEDRITDPAFLESVARHVRPSVVFDASGRILYDMGGMAYLEEIHVENPSAQPLPESITIVPKTFLSQAPLLSTLDQAPLSRATVTRGQGLSWVYTFGDTVRFGDNLDAESVRFRVELVPE